MGASNRFRWWRHRFRWSGHSSRLLLLQFLMEKGEIVDSRLDSRNLLAAPNHVEFLLYIQCTWLLHMKCVLTQSSPEFVFLVQALPLPLTSTSQRRAVCHLLAFRSSKCEMWLLQKPWVYTSIEHYTRPFWPPGVNHTCKMLQKIWIECVNVHLAHAAFDLSN